jgi:hypothetical protein
MTRTRCRRVLLQSSTHSAQSRHKLRTTRRHSSICRIRTNFRVGTRIDSQPTTSIRRNQPPLPLAGADIKRLIRTCLKGQSNCDPPTTAPIRWVHRTEAQITMSETKTHFEVTFPVAPRLIHCPHARLRESFCASTRPDMRSRQMFRPA